VTCAAATDLVEDPAERRRVEGAAADWRRTRPSARFRSARSGASSEQPASGRRARLLGDHAHLLAHRDNTCEIESGHLDAPYSPKRRSRAPAGRASEVDVEHAAVLGDAWQ
jgi:hypothetical protein